MKPKYGFSTYAKNKIPLNHKITSNTKANLGKLLPNGFRVSERVYYTSSFNTNRAYGSVVEYQHDGSFPHFDQPHFVWAKWERPNGDISLGYMPKDTVFRA